MKNIAIIGTGYVGLTDGACFADWGHNVTCVDIDESKVRNLRKGELPIYEPGLKDLVNKGTKARRLRFTTDAPSAIREAEVVYICVGTPPNQSGEADLSAVWVVAETIGKNLNAYKVVVTKSTVPVGTNSKIKEIISNASENGNFDICSEPEFSREGKAVYDIQNPDRIVIGYESEKALKIIREIYHTQKKVPFVQVDIRSAELIKYASNAFLAAKISFINEIGQIAERMGANIQNVADGMGYDKRIGRAFLNAGLGYGGSCFPKDVEALYMTSTSNKYDFRLLRGVMEVNELQRYYYMEKIKNVLGPLLNKTIAVLGTAFKQDTDDIRESVSIKLIKTLRGEGAYIRVYDPVALPNTMNALGEEMIYYAKDAYDAINNADALSIHTEWEEFCALDLRRVSSLLKQKIIFDGRNCLDSKEAKSAGVNYYGIGGYN